MRYEPGQSVRLTSDVPELELRRGQRAVVCSHWFDPMDFYELEFQLRPLDMKVRVVLSDKQFRSCESEPESELVEAR